MCPEVGPSLLLLVRVACTTCKPAGACARRWLAAAAPLLRFTWSSWATPLNPLAVSSQGGWTGDGS